MKNTPKLLFLMIVVLSAAPVSCAGGRSNQYPLRPVPFTDVTIDDAFWLPRLETNRLVTIPFDFRKCEETGRIDNFAKAGGLMDGEFVGIFFNDSDVFKVIEGASYSLSLHPDEKLEKYLDGLIAKIAAAQEDDGYLYTVRTIDPERVPPASGPVRWSNVRVGHELYNVGHLYEAATAHYRATGKRTLLDTALKNADLIASVFGPDGKRDVPGHEEIEIGLCKLYLATGERKYLDLAKFFLDERGRPRGRELYGAYCQDHEPVVEQSEAVGHAVRAGYLYSGMADAAALTGDKSYTDAIDRIWENVVSRKLYLTGGIGARHSGEAFGNDFELPNLSAYNETCAAIANAMWNHRLFLLHGDGKYIDVLERVIYNGFLSGVSLSGDSFFYPNPLESDGSHERSPWFGCSCCPANVVRFLPSLPGYAYAAKDDTVFVNLYIGGGASVALDNGTIRLEQKTRYPWDGKIRIIVTPGRERSFALNLRIPGWARGRPVPSDLYRYEKAPAAEPSLRVNGRPLPLVMEKGFTRIRRTWKNGDTIDLVLPMPIRRVLCSEKVEANQGRVALERGPIVYCAEWADNHGLVHNISLPEEAPLKAEHCPDLLGGVTVITGTIPAVFEGADGPAATRDGKTIVKTQPFTAIPYYAWAHRGPGEMAVWLASRPSSARPAGAPTIASKSRARASHTWRSDSTIALNDLAEPKSSADHEIRRFTFWNHKGTTEWVQYDFAETETIGSVAVYWFDDTGRGECRVPASWRVLYKDNGEWKEVSNRGPGGIEKDRFNRVSFEPVTTRALRLEVVLRKGFSGGILEWTVE